MKRQLLFLIAGCFSMLLSFAQVPPNDLIENATQISSFPTSDLNVQLGNATASATGEMGCSVSQTFPTVFYKFSVDFGQTVKIQLEDADSGSIPASTSFAIVYSAPTLNATSPSELSQISDCLFSTETTIGLAAGVNYYVVVYRDIGSGLNTNIHFTPVVGDVPASERDALIAFYNATGGDNWINNTNWNTVAPVSSWYGITTQEIDEVIHVSTLVLTNNNLNGTFPPEITDLTALRLLSIQNHFFLTGELPNNIGDLVNLTTVFLGNNGITGNIPTSFTNCPNLQSLYLNGNQFNGLVPDFTSLLTTSLLDLTIENNNFEFGDFENEFPTYQAWLGSYFTYTPQGLVDDNYSEIIALGNSTTLNSNISGTQNNYQWFKDGILLPGAINADLNVTINTSDDYGVYYYEATSDIVTGLTLQSNNFTLSSIPSTNADYDALVALYNSTNGDSWTTNTNWLDDSVPLSTWHGVTIENERVTKLYLGSNNLSGPLPIEIGDFTELTELGLWANQLSGTIPSEIGNLSNLTLLDLSPNTFSGEIPPEIGNLTSLEILWLNQNGLTGNIPTTLQNLTNLKELYLIGSAGPPYSSSAFSGVFPDLTALPLEVLQMHRNYFIFSDIADELATYQANIPTFIFSPQYTIDAPREDIANTGDDIVLDLTDVPSTRTASGRQMVGNDYQWYKDAIAISGANANSYTIINAQPSDSGIYHCAITNSDVPGMEILRAPITVNVESLGIDENALNTISIYPNPVQDGLTISRNNELVTKVMLYDISGRLIIIKDLEGDKTILPLNRLQTGIYLLKLITKNSSITKRIIKE